MTPFSVKVALVACLGWRTLGQVQIAGAAQTLPDSSLSKVQVIPLVTGSNRVDLNGDGKLDLVVSGWRDNANAHGSEIVTFYLANPGNPYIVRPWLIVPLYDWTRNHEQDSYRTSQGADCVLSDIRLVRSRSDPKAPVHLITADREFGETYVDVMPVTFTLYRFVADTTETPGWPPYYFQAYQTVRSQAKYCDVNDAFVKELGLGPREDLK